MLESNLFKYEPGEKPPFFQISPEMHERIRESNAALDQRMKEATDNLARQLAKQKDDILRAAVSTRLGTEDWKLEDLHGRVAMVVKSQMPGAEGADVYLLDGKPLAAFWPLQDGCWPDRGILENNWSAVPLDTRTFSNTFNATMPYKTFEP